MISRRSLPRPLLRVLPHPVLSVLLLLVWLLLVDSPSPSATGCSAPSSACAFRFADQPPAGSGGSQEWHPLLL